VKINITQVFDCHACGAAASVYVIPKDHARWRCVECRRVWEWEDKATLP
jgi:transposase-like protein